MSTNSTRAVLTVMLAAALPLSAAERTFSFDDPAALAGWTVTGDVHPDPAKTRPGAPGASLRLGPGGRAVCPLSATDAAAKVEFWVFEDGAVAAAPKQHGYGALWGVMDTDGLALVSGSLYAAYLGGADTYAVGEFHPAKAGDMPSLKCQYLGLPRVVGWHHWTFDMDAAKGLAILVDGKNVNAAGPRFDWNKTGLSGIASLFFGGDGGKGGKQVLWLSGLTVVPGGPMQVKPTPPPPPPPIVPDRDPAVSGLPIKLLDTVAGRHPRLLLDAERLPKIKAFFLSDQGKLYHDLLLGYLPGCTVPADHKTDHAWGQEAGLFKMPMLALHYVLTGDRGSFDRCLEFLKWLDGLKDWTGGGDEMNSDTTASFTMVGSALMWDWLYNDLDPAFREKFRRTLWWHARYMYYGGHLGGNPGGGYWRGVPAYNHRWFRDWGLALATLAATEGRPEEQWLLLSVTKELKFMADWLPDDGSQHEGPGYGSSAGALGMALQASDECLGTKYLDLPFFRNVGAYALEMTAPDRRDAIYFADCFTRALAIHPFFLKTATLHHQADVADGLRQLIAVNAKRFGIEDYAWLMLLSDDPSVSGGQADRLPTSVVMPDLGMAVVRDGWRENAVAAMFKCGPPGGYKANAWRAGAKDARGTLPYLNIAHDHPDANSFVLLADGEYLAETDRYPQNPGKLSTSLNTILVNGLGQIPEGRADGDSWWQPGSGDMTRMARLTAYKDAGVVVVAEGEAAGSYLPYTDRKAGRSRPALDRFRRTFIWVKGGYVLLLDDIRAPKPVTLTWLVQGARLDTVDAGQGRYRLAKGNAQCDFQLLADTPLAVKMGVSTANDHDKLLGWQQLQAGADGTAVRFAAVFDPWRHGDVRLTLTPDGRDRATLTVTSAGFRDTWRWEAATGRFEAATWHGTRAGGFEVTVDAASAAPPATE